MKKIVTYTQKNTVSQNYLKLHHKKAGIKNSNYLWRFDPKMFVVVRTGVKQFPSLHMRGYLHQIMSLLWSWPHSLTATLPILLPALTNNRPKRWWCLCCTAVQWFWALTETKDLSGTKHFKKARGKKRMGFWDIRGWPDRTKSWWMARRLRVIFSYIKHLAKRYRCSILPDRSCAVLPPALYPECLLRWCTFLHHSDCPPPHFCDSGLPRCGKPGPWRVFSEGRG